MKSKLRVLRLLSGYTVLGFLPIGVNFLLLPLYTAHLSPTQYGVLSEANVTQTFVQLAVGLGLDSSFARYYFDYGSDVTAIRNLFANVVSVMLLVTAALGCLLTLIGPWLFRAIWTDLPFERFGYLILAGAFGQGMFALLYMLHRNGEELGAVTRVSLLTTAGAAIGAAVALTQGAGTAFGAFAGKTAGSLIGFGLGALPVLRWLRFRIDRRLTVEMLKFGLPLIAYSLVAYVLFNGDRALMQEWFTLHDLGLYALAATLVSTLEILLQAGQQAVQPSLYRSLTAGEVDATERVVRFYAGTFAVCVVVTVLLVVASDGILMVLRGDKYVGATKFIALLGVGQLFRVLFNGYALPLYFTKRTTPLSITTALAIPAGLSVAFVTRTWLGPLSIAAGVAAWKAAQLFLTKTASRVYAPEVPVSMGRAYPLLAATGIWGTALYAVAPASANGPIVRWGGAAVLVFWAFLFLRTQIQSRPSQAVAEGTE